MQNSNPIIQNIQLAIETIQDPMRASETIKKLTHSLLVEAQGNTRSKLLQLMEQAEMLHEYQTDVIRFHDPITENTAEQNVRENILELLQSLNEKNDL